VRHCEEDTPALAWWIENRKSSPLDLEEGEGEMGLHLEEKEREMAMKRERCPGEHQQSQEVSSVCISSMHDSPLCHGCICHVENSDVSPELTLDGQWG
jgi:hypothetical protein